MLTYLISERVLDKNTPFAAGTTLRPNTYSQGIEDRIQQFMILVPDLRGLPNSSVNDSLEFPDSDLSNSSNTVDSAYSIQVSIPSFFLIELCHLDGIFGCIDSSTGDNKVCPHFDSRFRSLILLA